MQLVEGVVDLLERHRHAHVLIELDAATHVLIHELRHLGAAFYAAEGAAPPGATGHEQEGSRVDLFAGSRDADDDRLAPAAMST